MKRLSKFFLIIISFCPLILGANTREEVRYKFYTEVEDKAHYEKDVEHSCEYFEMVDKNNFIYDDNITTLSIPEEKEGRLIEEEIREISLSRDIITKLEINYFYSYKINKKIYEIEFFDSENNKVIYQIENSNYITNIETNVNDGNLNTYIEVNPNSKMKIIFEKAVDIKKLKIRITYENNENTFYGIVYIGYVNDIYADAYDYNSVNKTIDCDSNKCAMQMELKDKTPTDRDIKIKTKVYNYKDPMYKCYSLKRIYVPGYYTEMEGFIKDNEKYVVETIEDSSEVKDMISEELTLLNMSNENLVNEIKNIKDININEKIDDAISILSNNKDEEIINKINLLNNSISNLKEDDYSYDLNELKSLNNFNTEKLEKIEKLLRIIKMFFL